MNGLKIPRRFKAYAAIKDRPFQKKAPISKIGSGDFQVIKETLESDMKEKAWKGSKLSFILENK